VNNSPDNGILSKIKVMFANLSVNDSKTLLHYGMDG